MRAVPIGVCPVLTHFTQIPKFLLFVVCCFFNGRVGVRGDGWRTSSLNGGGIEGVGSVGLERQSSVGGGSLTRGGDRVRGARGEFIVLTTPYTPAVSTNI
jgi:hypothetical protein